MRGSCAGLLRLGRQEQAHQDHIIVLSVQLARPNSRSLDHDAASAFTGRAIVAASAAEVADRADIVFGCLQTVDQYRSAILGDTGVIRSRRARTYVHIGTTGRDCVRTLAAELAARAIGTVDAPMSGGVAGARAGTLVSMVSGPRAAFTSVEPCLAAYSKRIVYLGEAPGLGQTMKLANNMLSATNLVAAAEVLVVGAKAGIPVEIMLEVINNGTGQSNATLTKIPDNIISRTFDVGSTLHNALKDLRAYAAEAQGAGLDSAICRVVFDCFREAGAQGSIEDDFGTVVRPLERAAGVVLKRGGSID